jgi:hypothetical protein
MELPAKGLQHEAVSHCGRRRSAAIIKARNSPPSRIGKDAVGPAENQLAKMFLLRN